MTDNHTKHNLKARHGANSILGDRHNQATKHSLNSKVRFSVVTPVITHFFMKQAVATDNIPTSKAVIIYSGIAPQAHLSASSGQTIISIANHLLTDYDGLTLQNKIAVRRICGAVSNKTESKTRHPIPLSYSVAFTQNLLGAIHHG